MFNLSGWEILTSRVFNFVTGQPIVRRVVNDQFGNFVKYHYPEEVISIVELLGEKAYYSEEGYTISKGSELKI